MAKGHIVVGLSVDYGRQYLENLTDKEKHQTALYDEDAVIYDTPETFFNAMNNDLVDTENLYWFMLDWE